MIFSEGCMRCGKVIAILLLLTCIHAFGQTQSEGVAEFFVTNESGEPVEGANILLLNARTGVSVFCMSDADGLAAILLPVSQYSIDNVSGTEGQLYPGEDFVSVRAGATVRKNIRLFTFPTVRGIALDRQGSPLGGVEIRTVPMGQQALLSDMERGYELARTKSLLEGQQVTFSDSQGRFEAVWYMDKLQERQVRERYIILRHVEENMAAAVEIRGQENDVAVTMMPGVTISGKVVDSSGAGIAHARTTLYMVMPGWRMIIGELLTQVSENGEFAMPAVPTGLKLALNVAADGYGVRTIRLYSGNAGGRKLDLREVSLSRANLGISATDAHGVTSTEDVRRARSGRRSQASMR